jgi:regulator of RNase E activity RraB
MRIYYTKHDKSGSQEVIVNYELIEIAPDYMTPKMVYLFYKPEEEIEDFESYFLESEATKFLVSNDGLGYFAGARMIDGWVEVYFYTANSKVLRHALKEKLPPSIQHDLGSNSDDEWRFFFEKLNPNSKEKRDINNRMVVLDLLEAGDDPEVVREFEHVFFFFTESQREKVIKELQEIGHTVEEETIDEDMEKRFVLVTTHKSDAKIDTINQFHRDVAFIANKYHAQYDGWTTDIAKK